MSANTRYVTYRITIPTRRPPMTSNDERRWEWWRVRDAKAQAADMVGWSAKRDLPPGLRLNRVRVITTWYAPDARQRDSGAVAPFTKAAIDMLTPANPRKGETGLGILPGDHAEHVVDELNRVVVDRKNPRITVELEDLDSPIAEDTDHAALDRTENPSQRATQPPSDPGVTSWAEPPSRALQEPHSAVVSTDGSAGRFRRCDTGENVDITLPVCPECGSTGPRCTHTDASDSGWHVARELLLAPLIGCRWPYPHTGHTETHDTGDAQAPTTDTAAPSWRYKLRQLDERGHETHCLSCGAPLKHPASGRPRKYCSGKCRVKGHREAKKRAATDPMQRAAGAHAHRLTS